MSSLRVTAESEHRSVSDLAAYILESWLRNEKAAKLQEKVLEQREAALSHR